MYPNRTSSSKQLDSVLFGADAAPAALGLEEELERTRKYEETSPGPFGAIFTEDVQHETMGEDSEAISPYRGFYVPKDVRDEIRTTGKVPEDKEIKEIFDLYKKNYQEELLRISKKDHPTIFTVGPEGANNPQVKNHEYRHVVMDVVRKIDPKVYEHDGKKSAAIKFIQANIPTTYQETEVFNRLWDVYRNHDSAADVVERAVLAVRTKNTITPKDKLDSLSSNRERVRTEAEALISAAQKESSKFASIEAAFSSLQDLSKDKDIKQQREEYLKQWDQRKSAMKKYLDNVFGGNSAGN